MRIIFHNDEDARFSADFHKQWVSMHVVYFRWGIKKFRQYLRIFDLWVCRLREVGYKEVYATPFERDTKAQRMIALFGFKKLYSRNGHVVMQLKL